MKLSWLVFIALCAVVVLAWVFFGGRPSEMPAAPETTAYPPSLLEGLRVPLPSDTDVTVRLGRASDDPDRFEGTFAEADGTGTIVARDSELTLAPNGVVVPLTVTTANGQATYVGFFEQIGDNLFHQHTEALSAEITDMRLTPAALEILTASATTESIAVPRVLQRAASSTNELAGWYSGIIDGRAVSLILRENNELYLTVDCSEWRGRYSFSSAEAFQVDDWAERPDSDCRSDISESITRVFSQVTAYEYRASTLTLSGAGEEWVFAKSE